LLKLAPLFALPAIPFLLWRQYADGVNARQPDWFFLPTYFRYDDLNAWFFGPLEMRFDPANWSVILRQFVYGTVTPAGAVMLVLGVWFLRREKNVAFVATWILGAFVAIAIFFRLNVLHSYYQNPLIAIGAVGIAACFWYALGFERPVARRTLVAATTVFAVFAVACVAEVERSCYQIDWRELYAAHALAETTDEDALVVAVAPTVVSAQEPMLLGRAHRYGWPLPTRLVTPELLERLRGEGATAVAWLELRGGEPPPDVLEYLAGAPVDVRALPDGAAKLYVFHLAKADHR
jgi:hypothetical protein